MLKTRKYNKRTLRKRKNTTRKLRNRKNTTKKLRNRKTKYGGVETRGQKRSREELENKPSQVATQASSENDNCVICMDKLNFSLPVNDDMVPVRPSNALYSEAYHKSCLHDNCRTTMGSTIASCKDPMTRERFNFNTQLVKVPGPGIKNTENSIRILPPIAPQNNNIDINTELQALQYHRDNGPFNLAQAISGIGRDGTNNNMAINGRRIVEILKEMHLLSDEGHAGLPLDQYIVHSEIGPGLELEVPLAEWTRITGLNADDVESMSNNLDYYNGYIQVDRNRGIVEIVEDEY